MNKFIAFSKKILQRIKKSPQPLTEQQIRCMAVSHALEFIHKELAKDTSNTTLADEMSRLEEYTYTFEKLLNMQ